MMNPFNQHDGINLYSNRNINNPVCCAKIPPRHRVPLVLSVWIVGKIRIHTKGLSLYFSSLSFMGRSPFYSHIDKAALIVFGVVNLLFVILCLFGYSLHWVRLSVNRYRQYAKLIACCVAAVLLDAFANFVLFCIKRNDFFSWCQNKALSDMNQVMQQQNINSTQVPLDLSTIDAAIVFNCNRLFDAESKFGFAALVCITIAYVYWAGFINSDSQNFVMMRPEMSIRPPQPPPGTTAVQAAIGQQHDISNQNMAPPDKPVSTLRKQSQQHSIVLL